MNDSSSFDLFGQRKSKDSSSFDPFLIRRNKNDSSSFVSLSKGKE
jgi:hypothetical protein